MALIADFMLVWLSAPRMLAAGAAHPHRSALSKFLASCPDNAFQAGGAALPPGPVWTEAERGPGAHTAAPLCQLPPVQALCRMPSVGPVPWSREVPAGGACSSCRQRCDHWGWPRVCSHVTPSVN